MDAGTARGRTERPIVNLGPIGGGESVTTVPRTADTQVEIRLTAGAEMNEALADIRDSLPEHPYVTITDVSWSAGTWEPLYSPPLDGATRTTRTVIDGRIYRRSATGGGDAKGYREVGIPTAEFALGTDTARAVDDHTSADALTLNAEVYIRLREIWMISIE
ncbi:MAG: peptidase dimerization domain-containing protein [Halobacteriota archaeon]|uniref:peptidase dimerization domain-containing protein n=1 Tax=Natronomonas sp. TaxID=2184060 RepID=UPI0039763623